MIELFYKFIYGGKIMYTHAFLILTIILVPIILGTICTSISINKGRREIKNATIRWLLFNRGSQISDALISEYEKA